MVCNKAADAAKTLIVVTGPTGSGKTDLAISLARELHSEIISADSRQIFRDIPIGTAAPSAAQLAAAPHHFVGTLALDSHYSAASFEADVLSLLPQLWSRSDYAILCGGSMMYIDAVTNGIDNLPEISADIRRYANELYRAGGLMAIQDTLRRLDPDYYEIVDRSNHRRIIHAIEITLQAGVPYSTLRTGRKIRRPFRIVKLAIDMPRPVLFERINSRVEAMIGAGLEQEALALYPRRHLNSLNTLGYKELFAVIDGEMDRETAIARIQRNTRVYAKKQLTWLKRDPVVHYLPYSDPLPPALEWIRQ